MVSLMSRVLIPVSLRTKAKQIIRQDIDQTKEDRDSIFKDFQRQLERVQKHNKEDKTSENDSENIIFEDDNKKGVFPPINKGQN